jgi:hypothetical protein
MQKKNIFLQKADMKKVPSFVEIERILEVERRSEYVDQEEGKDSLLGLKNDHGLHDEDNDRQFVVKWENTPYSQSTYEYESDLISMKIEYEDSVERFSKRSKKPTMTEIKRDFVIKER